MTRPPDETRLRHQLDADGDAHADGPQMADDIEARNAREAQTSTTVSVTVEASALKTDDNPLALEQSLTYWPPEEKSWWQKATGRFTTQTTPHLSPEVHAAAGGAALLGALGVVYGDIGTSPLYAMNETFHHLHEMAWKHHCAGNEDCLTNTEAKEAFVIPAQEMQSAALGILSIIVWTLLLVVSVKYTVFVLRASMKSEGGTFALMGLMREINAKKLAGAGFMASISVLIAERVLPIAASFLFGEGGLTPPVSVLSALEGLKVVNPAMDSFIVPLALAILTALFSIQRRGTEFIGGIFGWIMLAWFISLAVFGGMALAAAPWVLIQALNPLTALDFLFNHPILAGSVGGMAFMALALNDMAILGSTVLAETGTEAMYADLGHFGLDAIKKSWFFIVGPSLLLNYGGQAAFIATGGVPIEGNIFFSIVPEMFRVPMVFLATPATVIASQALISGAFSLTVAAISFGLLPRLEILHTSDHHQGQIYIPAVNWMLYAVCALLVLVFKTSSALAAAYGMAVTTVMLITSVSMYFISRYLWKWGALKAGVVWGSLIVFIDGPYFIANALKFTDGAWIPVAMGLCVYVVMMSWKIAREHIRSAIQEAQKGAMTLEELVNAQKNPSSSLPVTARKFAFLSATGVTGLQQSLPLQASEYVRRHGSVPERVMFLTVEPLDTPRANGNRVSCIHFSEGVTSVIYRVGWAEQPDIMQVLTELKESGQISVDPGSCEIVVGNDHIIVDSDAPWYSSIGIALYRAMSRLSFPAQYYFGLGDHDGIEEETLPVHLGGPAGPRISAH